MSRINARNPEELYDKNKQNTNSVQTSTAKKDSYNPFEVYIGIQEEIYGESSNTIDSETFDKILAGELETDDILALSIIEAAAQDEDKTSLSEEELCNLYEDLASKDNSLLLVL